jgi:hypothetical protein
MIAVVVLRKDLKYRPLVPIFNAVAASLLYMCYDSMFFLKEDAGGNRGGERYSKIMLVRVIRYD